MAAASLRNVEIATVPAVATTDIANDGDDKNNSSRHTRCSGYSNQHTYHQEEQEAEEGEEHEQPKKRNIYHQTTNCHYHTGASILFWLAVILVLGELKTGKFCFLVFGFFLSRFSNSPLMIAEEGGVMVALVEGVSILRSCGVDILRNTPMSF